MVEIDGGPSIPESELTFVASRAGGPGGQHVNKVASRLTLRFDVENSPSLDDGQKRKLVRRLRTRITRDGVLVMHCGRHRSQAANRAELVERFAKIVAEALRPRRARKKTRPTPASRAKRLREKRHRGRIKRDRSARPTEED